MPFTDVFYLFHSKHKYLQFAKLMSSQGFQTGFRRDFKTATSLESMLHWLRLLRSWFDRIRAFWSDYTPKGDLTVYFFQSSKTATRKWKEFWTARKPVLSLSTFSKINTTADDNGSEMRFIMVPIMDEDRRAVFFRGCNYVKMWVQSWKSTVLMDIWILARWCSFGEIQFQLILVISVPFFFSKTYIFRQ